MVHVALFYKYRALLKEYRALLIEYRALLIKYGALVIEYSGASGTCSALLYIQGSFINTGLFYKYRALL